MGPGVLFLGNKAQTRIINKSSFCLLTKLEFRNIRKSSWKTSCGFISHSYKFKPKYSLPTAIAIYLHPRLYLASTTTCLHFWSISFRYIIPMSSLTWSLSTASLVTTLDLLPIRLFNLSTASGISRLLILHVPSLKFFWRIWVVSWKSDPGLKHLLSNEYMTRWVLLGGLSDQHPTPQPGITFGLPPISQRAAWHGRPYQ